MQLKLYSLAAREKLDFHPVDPDRVTMYVCGPTVYGPAHIGNARPAVVFDVLARLLRFLYPRLIYARNITDVDDKINTKAADAGVDISVISDLYKAKYREDMSLLGVAAPDIEPHATGHIEEMIEMIERLVVSGHAYEAEGHVLFEVAKDTEYGSLSGRNRQDMIDGARVEVAPFKRDAADFVLWKPSSEYLPGWESPWGRGRPGWHIECSAMIQKHLGTTIDIHGGGQDLQFPHHENEAAQSRCTNSAPLARYWLHNGMLNMSGEKMSKSLGNIALVGDLLADAPGEALRLALLQGHYRQTLDFTPSLLQQSVKNLDRLYGVLRDVADVEAKDVSPPEAFLEALCDDMNTPKALAELFVFSKSIETAEAKGAFLSAASLLGLLQQSPDDWFAQAAASIDRNKVEALIAERAEARSAGDYNKADAARDKLTAMGVLIEDGPSGTIWRLAR